MYAMSTKHTHSLTYIHTQRERENSTCVITLRNPGTNSFSHFILRVSGDLVSGTRGQASHGIALNMRVDRVLLNWVAVSSHVYRMVETALFVCASPDCRSPETKVEFYWELFFL